MSAFPDVIHLTSSKASHICERDGYNVTGFVLTNDKGDKCVVDMSAVRWLKQEEHWRVMHPQPIQTCLEEFERLASVWVMTKHDANVEFVLAAAEERNGYETGYYTDMLGDMLMKRFSGSETMGYDAMSVYGSISVTVKGSTEKDLDLAIVYTGGVVDEWIRKNNINRMKPHETN